ncbi:MAG TPA: DUF3080 family protein [Calditrichia bacterium]|nr:DUF3080 family protein [Calditrichota bacterium]HQU72790.1 DUF3080 family protein [Calditrichia bacterium]HQV33770.1 DUF3080 family protein [Calditrichia bacterium]
MKKPFRRLAFWLALLTLLACNQRSVPEEKLRAYLIQMRYACATSDSLKIPEPTATAYPRQRDIYLPIPEQRIDFLDFFSFRACELQVLIGERNSAMGRVMPPSQRLFYEHRFLVEAKKCLEIYRGDSEADSAMLSGLEDIIARKQSDLPRVYWNATFGNPGLKTFFAETGQFLPWENPDLLLESAEESLEFLGGIFPVLGTSTLVLNNEQLEERFRQVEEAQSGGKLLQSLTLLTLYLDVVSEVLERRIALAPLCSEGVPTPEARALYDVFTRHYVGGIQLYISRVHQAGSRLLTAIEEIYRPLGDEAPQAFANWYRENLAINNPQSRWGKFESALRRHTQTWQRVLDSCGLSPGAERRETGKAGKP